MIDRFLPREVRAQDEAKARMLVGFAWGLAAMTLVGLTLRLRVGAVDSIPIAIVSICTLAYAAVPWLLRATGSLIAAGVALNLTLLVLILTSGWYAGGIGAPVMTIAPLLPLVATFLLGGRTGLRVTILLAAALAAYFALSYAGIELPRPGLSERQELVARALFVGITIALTALLAGLYHRQRTATEEQLRQSRDLYRKLFDQSKDDVTERRRAEAEREALLAELTAKNEDLRQFTHAVSHDLKSPLTTVRGFIGLLQREARAGRLDHLERFAEAVDSGAEKMGRIIDGLLELAQIGRGKLSRSEVALDQVALDAVELSAKRIAAAGAAVEVAPDLPAVEGDPALLLTVLENLIDNGVKYSSGRLDPEIRVGWRRDGGETVFTVADNGAGIKPEYHRQIFDLFRQLHPDDEGTGIGLASVRRALEAHGGRIWVESEGEGRGSTFCFTVPARSGSEIIDLGDRRDLLAGR